MREEEYRVNCQVHGEQPETFVCQHIVMSLNATQPVGFWWAEDPGIPIRMHGALTATKS